MRRKDLIKRLEANGWTLYRHGGNHDIYKKGKSASACHVIRKLMKCWQKQSSEGEGFNKPSLLPIFCKFQKTMKLTALYQ